MVFLVCADFIAQKQNKLKSNFDFLNKTPNLKFVFFKLCKLSTLRKNRLSTKSFFLNNQLLSSVGMMNWQWNNKDKLINLHLDGFDYSQLLDGWFLCNHSCIPPDAIEHYMPNDCDVYAFKLSKYRYFMLNFVEFSFT